jgi:inner membrane protein
LPTIISHAAVAAAGAFGYRPATGFYKLLALGIICSLIPDVDVVGYQWFYIPYKSFFGHRGFFHSFFFAALFSALIVGLFYRKEIKFSKTGWKYFLYFFMVTSSHGLLDALTNGGQGVALLSPFSNSRYFFPWTPIEVSPFSPKAFLSLRGWTVLKAELLWIWMPSVLVALLLRTTTRIRFKQQL